MPLFTDVVPPAVLRKVPALSSRFTPPLKASGAALAAWNNAPARLVITPLNRNILPAPLHCTVPPFSNTRFRLTLLAGLSVKVTPGGITVRPLPLIVPADHEESRCSVNAPLPVKLPVVRVRLPQAVLLFSVTLTLLVRNTLSFVPGTKSGLQFEATFQSPLALFVQVMSYEPR